MKKSFTLIELLIVLVIIGVLTILAVPQYKSYVLKAQGAEAMRNVRTLADSLWMYYVETGDFPPFVYPDGDIPSTLGVSIPKDQSKSFNYYYQLGTQNNVPYYNIEAWYKTWGEQPIGAVVGYTILYAKSSSFDISGKQVAGRSLDGVWYVYYYHLVKILAYYEQSPGWPGN